MVLYTDMCWNNFSVTEHKTSTNTANYTVSQHSLVVVFFVAITDNSFHVDKRNPKRPVPDLKSSCRETMRLLAWYMLVLTCIQNAHVMHRVRHQWWWKVIRCIENFQIFNSSSYRLYMHMLLALLIKPLLIITQNGNTLITDGTVEFLHDLVLQTTIIGSQSRSLMV